MCQRPKIRSPGPNQGESELGEMHSLRDSSSQGQRSDGRLDFRWSPLPQTGSGRKPHPQPANAAEHKPVLVPSLQHTQFVLCNPSPCNRHCKVAETLALYDSNPLIVGLPYCVVTHILNAFVSQVLASKL